VRKNPGQFFSAAVEPTSAPPASRQEKRDVFDLHRYLKERGQIIERALVQSVEEPAGAAARLHEAMRYSLLAGGKRLRPVLVLASC